MWSVKDIKRVGGNLYKDVATKSQFGKDIGKAGYSLGSSLYGAFDTARNLNNGKYKDAIKSGVTTYANAKNTAKYLPKAVGDVAYQAAGVPIIKDTGKAFQEKRYKDGLLLGGLSFLQLAPWVGKPASIALKAKVAADATSKTARALNAAKTVSELPSKRVFSEGSPSLISKVAPNTPNKFAYGYAVPIKTAYDYNKAYSEMQTQGSTTQPKTDTQSNTSNTSVKMAKTSTQSATTKPTSNISTTSASIPASNNNQTYAVGTATAPEYQAPQSVAMTPQQVYDSAIYKYNNQMGSDLTQAETEALNNPPATNATTTQPTVAVNPQVQAKTDAYAAALKIAEAQAGVRLQGIMDKNLASQQQAMGMAADTYGGRAPAILGQSLTGVARDLNLNVQNESLKELETTGALGSTYDEAIRAAVEKQYADRINIAQKRANLIQQVAQIQGGRM